MDWVSGLLSCKTFGPLGAGSGAGCAAEGLLLAAGLPLSLGAEAGSSLRVRGIDWAAGMESVSILVTLGLDCLDLSGSCLKSS